MVELKCSINTRNIWKVTVIWNEATLRNNYVIERENSRKKAYNTLKATAMRRQRDSLAVMEAVFTESFRTVEACV